MRELFKDFGKVEYNGYTLTDISKRVKILEEIKNDPAYYFEYDIEGFERPEHLAQDFYEDPKFTWLIFLMNDIIDPIYDWILPEDVLATFIDDKYGILKTDVKYYNYNGDIVLDNTGRAGATPITNEEYEIRINESKRKIKILRNEYASLVMNEIRSIL